jgi:SMC interacting uncharacterized protein involved in chromosome segregation
VEVLQSKVNVLEAEIQIKNLELDDNLSNLENAKLEINKQVCFFYRKNRFK